MEGRGWGHGIGMCQYGADGYALHGWKYDAIIKHYYTGVTLGKVANVPIRVLLRSGVSSIVVTDAAQFKASWTAKTVQHRRRRDGHRHLVGRRLPPDCAARSSWTAGAPITFVAETSKLKLLTANDNGVVGHYRGTLRVVHFTDGLEVVNKLPLESYLLGVVPRESPASWPLEALKAQAVAARSYAFRETGGSGSFDVYCTTASQMYGGADAEAASTDKAVTATRGIVPKYLFKTSGRRSWPSSSRPRAVTPRTSRTSGAGPLRALPQGRARPLRHDLALPHLARQPHPPHARLDRRRSGLHQGPAAGRLRGQARHVAPSRQGTADRRQAVRWPSTAPRLRADLGLRDTWVYFTSLSINPSTTTTIDYGSSVTLTGKRYPRLPAGKTVTLHRRPAGGSWVTRGTTMVAGSIVVTADSTRYTAKYTAFSAKVTPGVTTQYYFSAPASMTASSVVTTGHVTVDVRPVATIKASSVTPAVGTAVTFTGTVKPAISGETVWLQTKTSTGWSNAVKTTLAADGSYKVSWTPTAAGTTTLRLRVPASSTLVAGVSPTVAVTAS